jgi:hypothetical protein
MATVGIDAQRQYEWRATFRNLALSSVAPKCQVDLITHPKPTQALGFRTVEVGRTTLTRRR